VSALPILDQTVTVETLDERAREFLPRVRAGAGDRERDRVMPHEFVRELAALQLGTYRVPRSHGGPGGSVEQAIGFVIELAAADSNIAQAVRPHFGFVESLRQNSSGEEQDRWLPRVRDGALFGLANGEVGAANGVIRARIRRDGKGFRADGSKYYSTGCLFADWLTVSALDEDGERVSFVIPAGREGVALLDDWDGMGQRLTASGTTLLEDVYVAPEEILSRTPPEGYRNHTTAFQQLYLGAVEAGIARNVLEDATWFAQKRSRPIKHSTATRSVDDPYIQHPVGEIAARSYAAEAVILRAAATLDRALARRAAPRALTDASVEVAQAQFVAIDLALKCAELIFDVGGGSATAREHNFDRHWRNARTVANHNPRYYKAGVVGAYRLTGAEPPTTGLF
jgi:alkylation response protein AidB-like acyl-CoA dehydrogenase